MFGNDASPSRIYAYGANAPTEKGDLVGDLIWRAHRYRNTLVELERKRRERVAQALKEVAPGFLAVDDEIKKLETERDALRDEIKKKRARARKRVKDPETEAKIKEIRARLKPLYETRKEAKREIFGSANVPERKAHAEKKKEVKERLADLRRDWKTRIAAAPRGERAALRREFQTAESVVLAEYEGNEAGERARAKAPWAVREAQIESEHHAALIAARAANGLSGCWGTYLAVEQSLSECRKGAPPQFQRWRGDGKVALQFQGGLSPAEAFGGEDTRLRIEHHPEGVWVAGKKQPIGEGPPRPRKLGNAIAWIRVDSDKRRPVWAKVPFYFHRPILEDASIQWVWLLRRRIGTHERWSLQFVLSRAAGWEQIDRATSGAVGIDIGWRALEDGRLRVALWVGDDGTKGELALPSWWRTEMRQVENIRSIRDGHFNEALASLVGWARERAEKGDALPDWLIERVRSRDDKPGEVTPRVACARLAAWRSTARLARLVLAWGKSFDVLNGSEGDIEERLERLEAWRQTEGIDLSEYLEPWRPDLYETLEKWRQRDRHLLEYEANLRDQLQGSRADLYRVFAAQIRRKYQVVALEAVSKKAKKPERLMDLRPFHEIPEPEEEPGLVGPAKLAARDACLSMLRQYLVESVASCITIPAPETTRRCHACGVVNSWNQAADLFHTCSGCARRWDQDENAARNLLASGAMVM